MSLPGTKKIQSALCLLAANLCLQPTVCLANNHEGYNEFLDLDLTELMKITITSVSKKPEPRAEAAAAVFVITQDDIKRSGVTTFQDVLRLAPGVQVAKISSDKWAITTRGFNGQYSNKLLVLIDGRTIYSPTFSGVYWDAQGTLLEDIERIEVIRGPGATVWGANAVNGVINIITKSAEDTTGGLVTLVVGTEEKVESTFRYGHQLSETSWGRIWLSYSEKDSSPLFSGRGDANDDWESIRGGFRLDGKPNARTEWTLQGDIYTTDANQLIFPYLQPFPPFISGFEDDYTTSGWNILGRWQYETLNGEVLSAQIYYDFFERDEVFVPHENTTFDIELQYQKDFTANQQVTVGLGYRRVDSGFMSSFQAQITSPDEEQNYFSGFIQDAISLIPDALTLTLGTKWEQNEHTGHQWQPSVKVLYKPLEHHSFWAAISRARKEPSQFEIGGSVIARVDPNQPPFPAIYGVIGADSYEAETLIAYETGYRWYASKKFSLDLAIFYNAYDKLADSDLSKPIDRTFFELNNEGEGTSYGAEIALKWKPWKRIHHNLSYSFIQLDMSSGSLIPSSKPEINEESAPAHQLSLFTKISLTPKWNLNVWLSYIDNLGGTSRAALMQGQTIDEYIDLDLTISYQATENLTFKLVGQNLLEPENLEYISETFVPPTEIEQGIYLKALWSF